MNDSSSALDFSPPTPTHPSESGIRLRRALQLSEDRLRLATQTGKIGIWEWDVKSNQVTMTDSLFSIYGLSPDDFDGSLQAIVKLVHEEDLAAFNASMTRALNGPESIMQNQVEFRMRKPLTGEIVWVFATATVYRENGAAVRVMGATVDVTESRLAEEERRLSDARFRMLADNAPVGIFQMDNNGNCHYVNETWCAMSGRSYEENLKRGWADCIHPEDRDEVVAGWFAAVNRGEGFAAETRIQRPDGTSFWVLGTAVQLLDPRGQRAGYIGSIVDITERKHAEEITRQANALLEKRVRKRTAELTAANAMFQAMYDQGLFAGVLDTSGVMIDVNRSALEQCGFRREDVIGRPFWDTGWWNRDPAVRAWIKAGFAQALEGQRFQGESAYFNADGSQRYTDFALTPIKDERGRVQFLVPTGLDITDRKQADEQARLAAILKDSEARFRFMADHAPVMIWTTDAQGLRNWCNKPWLDFVGRPIEEQLGFNWLENVHPEDRDEFRKHVRRAFRRLEAFTCDYRLRRHDGVDCWVMDHGVPLFDDNGRFAGYIGSCSDITDRKEAEVRLRQATRLAETLNRVGKTLSAQLDLKTVVQNVTDEAVELIGAEFGAFFYNLPDEAKPRYQLFTLTGASRETFEKLAMPRNTPLFEPTFRGEAPVRIDDVLKDPRYGLNPPYHGIPEGHLPVRSYLAVPVVSSASGVIGGLFFGHTETARFTEQHERLVAGLASQAAIAIENARLYGQVIEADRRKDDFLAMLAHELRNPLAPIRSGLDLLSLTGADPDVVQPMQQQLEHLIRLVDDLLDVSRIMRGKVQLRKQSVELSQVITRACEIVRPLVTAANQHLAIEQPSIPLWLHADPVRLSQVVGNLLNNASKYSNNGGHITLSVAVDGNEAIVRIADDGVGIDRSLLPRVFDLFTQSAHAVERSQGGLGIGLTVVKSLVELHDGSVTAESPGRNKGSTFTIRLPVVAEAAPQ